MNQTIRQRFELAKAEAQKTGKPAGFVCIRRPKPAKPPAPRAPQ